MKLNSTHESEIIKSFGSIYGIDLIKKTFDFYRIQNFKDANGNPLLLKNVENSLKEIFAYQENKEK